MVIIKGWLPSRGDPTTKVRRNLITIKPGEIEILIRLKDTFGALADLMPTTFSTSQPLGNAEKTGSAIWLKRQR